MEQVKMTGLTIERYEDDDDQIPDRLIAGERVILSSVGCSYTHVEVMKIASIEFDNGDISKLHLQEFNAKTAPINMRLSGAEMKILMNALKGHQESHQIAELRGLYDALVAENARLKEEEAVFIENQIAATEDIERITEIKNDIDDECLRLDIQLTKERAYSKKLEETVYQANTKCGKAVNHAEILERRAKELLEAVNDDIADRTAWESSTPENLRHAVLRLEKYLDDCAAHKQLEALTPGGDAPEPVLQELPF